jgi:Flp pilus assembly secretin CpaC
MTSKAITFTLLVAAIGFLGAAAVVPVWAEGGDTAALAAALKNATATLQGGLKASEAQGTPISAKFEIKDGKLQLSIYTMKGNDFMEVVADPNTAAIAKAEKITDAGDLKEAAEQKAAMAKAKMPLLTATDKAVNANAGSRAVSIVPELKSGLPTAEVTLLQGMSVKTVTEKLD